MTPKKKTANSTSLAMERKRLQPSGDQRKTSIHVAGADTVIITGIIQRHVGLMLQWSKWSIIICLLSMDFTIKLIVYRSIFIF